MSFQGFVSVAQFAKTLFKESTGHFPLATLGAPWDGFPCHRYVQVFRFSLRKKRVFLGKASIYTGWSSMMVFVASILFPPKKAEETHSHKLRMSLRSPGWIVKDRSSPTLSWHLFFHENSCWWLTLWSFDDVVPRKKWWEKKISPNLYDISGNYTEYGVLTYNLGYPQASIPSFPKSIG